jgi:hypothetical protein
MGFDEYERKARQEYAAGKKRFYADPVWASLVGVAVGAGGVLLLQWLF